jgi:hypothetical protein
MTYLILRFVKTFYFKCINRQFLLTRIRARYLYSERGLFDSPDPSASCNIVRFCSMAQVDFIDMAIPCRN